MPKLELRLEDCLDRSIGKIEKAVGFLNEVPGLAMREMPFPLSCQIGEVKAELLKTRIKLVQIAAALGHEVPDYNYHVDRLEEGGGTH